MELSNTVTLFIAVGTQLVSALALFWGITNHFNGKINGLDNRLTAVEKDIEYIKKDLDRILSYFPAPKLSIQQPEA
jgi:hypothetical protein